MGPFGANITPISASSCHRTFQEASPRWCSERGLEPREVRCCPDTNLCPPLRPSRALPGTLPRPQDLELSGKLLPAHLFPDQLPSPPTRPQDSEPVAHCTEAVKLPTSFCLLGNQLRGECVFKGFIFLQTSLRKITGKARLQGERTFSKFIAGIHYSWGTFEKAKTTERN